MNEWSEKWPEEEGFYWFYGGYKREKFRLKTAQVKHAGSEPNKFWMYIVDGAFLYKGETKSNSFWLKMEIPKLPTIEK